jgi:hypothetical protein
MEGKSQNQIADSLHFQVVIDHLLLARLLSKSRLRASQRTILDITIHFGSKIPHNKGIYDLTLIFSSVTGCSIGA